MHWIKDRNHRRTRHALPAHTARRWWPGWAASLKSLKSIAIVALVTAALLLVFWVSWKERIVLADIQLPEELAKQGYNSERLETVIQQALENLFEHTGPTMKSTLALNLTGGLSQTRAFAPQAYETALLESREKQLTLSVAGLSLPAKLLAHLAASMLPGAKRQSLVYVQVLAPTKDDVDVQVVVKRSDRGTAVHRVQGPLRELVEPSSETAMRVAFEILRSADPSAAAANLLSLDSERCNCVSESTYAFFDAHFDEIPPISLTGHFIQMATRLRPTDSMPTIEPIRSPFDRLIRRARMTHADGPWQFFNVSHSPSQAAGYCANLPAMLRAIERSADDRRINESLTPLSLLLCAWQFRDLQTLQDLGETGLRPGAKPLTRATALLVPFVKAQLTADAASIPDEKLRRLLTELQQNDRDRAFEGWVRYMTGLLAKDADAIVAAVDPYVGKPVPSTCGDDDFKCIVDRYSRTTLFREAAVSLMDLREQPAKAAEFCESAMALNRSDPYTAKCLARAYVRLGNVREARGWLALAYRGFAQADIESPDQDARFSNDIDAHSLRLENAALWFQQGFPDRAKQLIKGFSQSGADFGESSDLTAWIAAEQCDRKTLLALSPDKINFALQLELLDTRMAIAKGQFAQARYRARKLIVDDRLMSGDYSQLALGRIDRRFQGLLLMGLADLAEGLPEAAVVSLSRATETVPVNEEARLALAEAKAQGPSPAVRRKDVCRLARFRYGSYEPRSMRGLK